jgi:hypothetical protein
MRVQVGSRFVEFVIEIQVEMVRLQVHDEKHRGHCAGKFTEGVIHLLRLQRHALPEAFIMDLCG